MSAAVRFSVSLDEQLLARFDEYLKGRAYTNRSEAVRDLIRDKLVEEQWQGGSETVAAAVILVYDHDKLDLVSRLTDQQHRRHELVVSSMHVHTDEHNCLEVILLRGPADQIRRAGDELVSLPGVRFGRVNLATTGAGLP